MLIPIIVPDSIRQNPHSDAAAQLIDDGNDQIEKFMLETDEVTENFVTCDFHLVDQALSWIQENHLLAGNRFCEFGSGFGMVTMLAALRGMEAVGIEIDSDLVKQSSDFAALHQVDAGFFLGSFIPRDAGVGELTAEIEHVETQEDDVYAEIGLELNEFDLCFAFPWPGEDYFFEAVFNNGAASGALLLTYRGINGIGLSRKE